MENLPPLKGSTKQVEWAERIRSAILNKKPWLKPLAVFMTAAAHWIDLRYSDVSENKLIQVALAAGAEGQRQAVAVCGVYAAACVREQREPTIGGCLNLAGYSAIDEQEQLLIALKKHTSFFIQCFTAAASECDASVVEATVASLLQELQELRT